MLTNDDYDKILEFISIIQDNDNVNIKQWRTEVLKTLSSIFGFTHMSFFCVDEQEQFSDPAKINVNEKYCKIYQENLYKYDIFHTCNIPKHLLFKNIILVTDITDYATFENTVFYHEFLKKQYLRRELAVPLSVGDRVIGILGILKPEEMGEFTQKELVILNKINKHIARSFKKQLDLALTKHEHLIYKLFSHQSPVGLILVDSKFTVIQNNEMALELCTGFVDESKECSNPVQVVADEIALSCGNMFQLPNFQVAYKSYSFKISPFIINAIHGIDTLYAIFITKNSSKSKNSLKSIQGQYNLTRRELEIVELISKGYNNKLISDELFISIHTVKTHVENILKKMKASNRAEVMAKTSM